MAKDTKERILDAALEIFARDGYAGTNIKDIAESVGVVKSAFYRHYKSKEEIWDEIIDKVSVYYEERFGSRRHLPIIPENTEELKELTLRMIGFTVHDKKVVLIRRILLTEQFRSGQVRSLATKHFNTDLESLFTEIFARMMKNGSLKNNDPAMLAFTYTASISSLVHLVDREPEREAEVMEKITMFVKHFIETYGENSGIAHI